MSREHPYRGLPIHSNAPFELKPSLGKGWGAFSTRRIEQGTIIFRESPLLVVPKLPTEADLWATFWLLRPREKTIFLSLRDNGSKSFRSMQAAFFENSFPIKASPQFGNPPLTDGLFVLHSRFNNSCYSPNTTVTSDGTNGIKSLAIRNIEAGEELTFCYNPDLACRTSHERRQRMSFVCCCKACLPGTPLQQLSDMRRWLIRGLLYLTSGADLDMKPSSIIFDAKLKRQAEESSIPLCSRFLCYIMAMALLEQEGLMDDDTLRAMEPGILQSTCAFGTEENRNIASLVIQQKTYSAKFCVAFKLYGRDDAADSVFAEKMRGVKWFFPRK